MITNFEDYHRNRLMTEIVLCQNCIPAPDRQIKISLEFLLKDGMEFMTVSFDKALNHLTNISIIISLFFLLNMF